MKKSLLILILFYFSNCYSIEVSLGTDSDVSGHIPLDPFYHNMYSEMLYRGSFFPVSGEITSIAFKCNLATPHPEDYLNSFSIYLGEVDTSNFSGDSDWEYSDNFEEVFSEEITGANFVMIDGQQYMHIELTSSFSYDNSHNLVLSTICNKDENGISSDDFLVFPINYIGSQFYISNNDTVDINSLPEIAFQFESLASVIFTLEIDDNIPVILEPESGEMEVSLDTSFLVDIPELGNLSVEIDDGFSNYELALSHIEDLGNDHYRLEIAAPFSPDKSYECLLTNSSNAEDYTSTLTTFTTTATSPNFALNYEFLCSNEVNIYWNELFDNKYEYLLYRDNDLLVVQNSSEYTDRDINIGDHHTYQVKILCNNGANLSSSEIEVNVNSSATLLITDEFEDYESFSHNIGNWDNIDSDNLATYVLEGFTYPHAGEEQAYQVFTPLATVPPLPLTIKHNNCLVSFAAVDGVTSDILVSPDLALNNILFEIRLRSYTANYGLDRYRVGVYLNNDESNMVVLSEGAYETAPVEFTTLSYSYEVPEGNQISNVWLENCSNSSFMLVIDEIKIYTQQMESNSHDISDINNFRCHPNPSKGIIKWQSVKAINKIKIYNLRGQLIEEIEPENPHKGNIKLAKNLARGLYFIRSSNGSISETNKLIYMY